MHIRRPDRQLPHRRPDADADAHPYPDAHSQFHAYADSGAVSAAEACRLLRRALRPGRPRPVSGTAGQHACASKFACQPKSYVFNEGRPLFRPRFTLTSPRGGRIRCPYPGLLPLLSA